MNWELFFAACLGLSVGFFITATQEFRSRQRCYFCWRTAHGYASSSETCKTTGTTWTVQRWHCRKHQEAAMDIAVGTVQRLTRTGPWVVKP